MKMKTPTIDQTHFSEKEMASGLRSGSVSDSLRAGSVSVDLLGAWGWVRITSTRETCMVNNAVLIDGAHYVRVEEGMQSVVVSFDDARDHVEVVRVSLDGDVVALVALEVLQ